MKQFPGENDVAILGGGLAGLLLADALADRARVVLYDGPRSPAAASRRSLGIAARGGMDSPARLAHALPEQAADLWRYSARAVEALLDRAEGLGVSVSRCGSNRVSIGDDEQREWEASHTLLDRWGLTARPLEPEELGAVGVGFAGGTRVEGDGWVDLPALLTALDQALEGRVTRRPGPARITASLGGVTVSCPGGAERVELCVVAAGIGAASAHPWFGPMIVPVRLQGLRIRGPGTGIPALARHRFEAWCGEGFVGCRWAEQPEMGAGITDDITPSEAVRQRSLAFLSEHRPDLDPSRAEAFCGIAAWSCDGLPLVGALPGEPRVLALTGWGGWGLSWIGAAVRDLAAAILEEGMGTAVPPALRPRRMA